jgi:hypothetical protein
MTTLLALDPGGTTGYSVWFYDAITPLRPIEHGQIKGGLIGFVNWWQSQDADWDEVVSESFILDGRTPFPDVTPLKIEGALAVLFPDHILQRNVYKASMPNEKIKALGLWWPGQPHALDSLRHAWALMKERKHMPTLMAAWPPRVPASSVLLFNSEISPLLRPLSAEQATSWDAVP